MILFNKNHVRVKNKTIIGLKYWKAPFDKNKGDC